METSPFVNGICHIRTNPGDDGWFAPPVAVEDYAAWLDERFAAAQGKDGDRTLYFGFAQAALQIVYGLHHQGLRLRYEGAHGDLAAQFINALRGTTE